MRKSAALLKEPKQDQPGGAAPVEDAAPTVRTGLLMKDQIVELCETMIDIAAALFSVSGRELRERGRTSDAATRVRQIAMYVCHVVLRLSMRQVGYGFGRDRTTVLHACRMIEDMREHAEFDRVVSMMERIAMAAFRGRAGTYYG